MDETIRWVVDGTNKRPEQPEVEGVKEMTWKCDRDSGIFRGETAYLHHISMCRDSHMVPLGYISESEAIEQNPSKWALKEVEDQINPEESEDWFTGRARFSSTETEDGWKVPQKTAGKCPRRATKENT